MRKKAVPLSPEEQSEPKPLLPKARRAAEADIAIRRLGKAVKGLHEALVLPCPACDGAPEPAVRTCWRCHGRGSFYGRSESAELQQQIASAHDMIRQLIDAIPRDVEPDYTLENRLELLGDSFETDESQDREWREDLEDIFADSPSRMSKRSAPKQRPSTSRQPRKASGEDRPSQGKQRPPKE